MQIPRALIVDLWPLCASGDASPESCAFVEEFLRGDPELAAQLRREPVLPSQVPPLPPDHEARALSLTRRRLHGLRWLLMFALMFSAQAFGRIVSDTSWDVSPLAFVITAAIAGVFWIAYLVSLWRMRARILIMPGPVKRTG